MDREQFTSQELDDCLSHYDLGQVHSVQEFPRGAHRAPKVLIQAQRGRFLFKRRIPGRDDLARVRFTHQVQRALAEASFPLPALIRTREGQTLLVIGGRFHEMFEFVSGQEYDASLEATYHAGAALGRYHQVLAGFHGDYTPPTGSYHNARTIYAAIGATIPSLPLGQRPPIQQVLATVDDLQRGYRSCARKVQDQGLDAWPVQIVHGDWHPGNMLFHRRDVAAVVDYDSARLQRRVIDLANGALQFSFMAGEGGPQEWPALLDQSRFKRFLRGYNDANPLAPQQRAIVPYLMCEAMIAEAVLPVAATGSFGRFQGFAFLEMVDRKVHWILEHLGELLQAADV
jgi:homoserine kinase type II